MDPIPNHVHIIGAPLYNAKGWMKLVGVLSIIYGVMIALTIAGLLIAWLPIWIGILLFQSASALEQAQNTGDESSLVRCLEKLRLYFTILGVLALIGLFILVISLVMGGLAGLAGAHY